MIVAADLQGRETFQSSGGKQPRLIGEVIPSLLREMVAEMGCSPENFGVLLAGDLDTVPGLDRRGGSGDVTEVWQAFSDHFGWVAGVAGNHDSYESCCDRNGAPQFPSSMHFLNDRVKEVAGIKMGGVNGIIGNPKRPWRKEQSHYCETYLEIACQSPDMVVMHDGPNDPVNKQKGCDELGQLLLETPPHLIVRGHAHWKIPLVQFSSSHQVLNVDSRVVILIGVGQ